MTKSLFRALFAVTGAALLAVTALPAAGATLTYNDPNCAGFQITGSGGSFTLTCAKLSCSISGLTTPTTAQDTSLTATCTPSGARLSVEPRHRSVQPRELQRAVGADLGDDGHRQADRHRRGPDALLPLPGKRHRRRALGPGDGDGDVERRAADAAGLHADGVTTPTPITSAGGTVSLNAGCVPSAGVTYTWTRTAPTAGAPTNPTSATPTDTLAANTGASAVTYTWQVVACTSPTTCDTKSITVNVPAPGGGGGGVSCSGFTKTIMSTSRLARRQVPRRFTRRTTAVSTPRTCWSSNRTASADADIGTLARRDRCRSAEYGDPATNRYAVLTTSPVRLDR